MYEITIKQRRPIVKTIGKEWKLCGPEGDAAYAYTPEIEKLLEEEQIIYCQKIEELDLAAVLRAVNGL